MQDLGQVHVVDDSFLRQFAQGHPLSVLLKCDSSANIYVLENGRKQWIKDIATFTAQGFIWPDAKMVTCAELAALPDGMPIRPMRARRPRHDHAAIGAGRVPLALAALVLTQPEPGRPVIATLVAAFAVAALALLAAALAFVRAWSRPVPSTPAYLRGLWRVAAGMLLAAGAGGLSLVATDVATQPPGPCTASQSPSSTPPARLITAADYFAEGDYDFDRGDCAATVADYTRSIALDPQVAEVYNNRAYTYMS